MSTSSSSAERPPSQEPRTSQFKNLSTLSTTELLAYLDAMNKELFSIPEQSVVTVLPWSCQEVPTFDDAKKVLEQYQPTKVDKNTVTTQVKIFLTLVENAKGVKQKEYCCRHLFRLLAANTWYMEEYERFRTTVKNKLLEFETDNKEARKLAQEFSWMKENPYPKLQTCSCCGASGRWTTFDGLYYYCKPSEVPDPTDITDAAREFISSVPDKEITSKWIQSLCSEYRNRVAINDYDLARKYRNILGEEDFSYKMHEVEWGDLYEICPAL